MKALPWFLALIIAIVTYAVGRRDGRNAAADDDLDRRTKAAHDSALDWVLHQTETGRVSRADAPQRQHFLILKNVAKSSADSLALRVANLEEQLRGSVAGADSLLVYRDLVLEQRLEIGKLRSALEAAMREILLWQVEAGRWKQLADEAAPVIASLEGALAAEHDARKCYLVRLLKIGCPSRGVLVLGTAVVSVTGTLLVIGATR